VTERFESHCECVSGITSEILTVREFEYPRYIGVCGVLQSELLAPTMSFSESLGPPHSEEAMIKQINGN